MKSRTVKSDEELRPFLECFTRENLQQIAKIFGVRWCRRNRATIIKDLIESGHSIDIEVNITVH